MDKLSAMIQSDFGDDIAIVTKTNSSQKLLQVVVSGSGEELYSTSSSSTTMSDKEWADLKEEIEDTMAEQQWLHTRSQRKRPPQWWC